MSCRTAGYQISVHPYSYWVNLKAKTYSNSFFFLCFQVSTEDNELSMVFYASTQMKETLRRFPEHILVDATYCLNRNRMPLIVFMVTDGNNCSKCVAIALVKSEQLHLVTSVFNCMKSLPGSENIKTFMCDKDFTEMKVIESLFPEASIEICLFHTMKAMKKKIQDLTRTGQVDGDALKRLVTDLADARNEAIYDELHNRLTENFPSFSPYFNNQWHCIRHGWTAYMRGRSLNFGDATNNRVENMNR